MKVATILGTTRPGNYTGKALAVVNDELRSRDVEVAAIDPALLGLQFPGASDPGEGHKQLQAAVEEASGIVFATPEYHGGFSAMTKLVIENLGFPSLLSGKAIALLGVAAGSIGAIKSLEQLRSVCSHVGAIVLPGPVSVAGVRRVFDEAGNCTDAKVEKRIRGLATNLVDYLGRHQCSTECLEAAARS